MMRDHNKRTFVLYLLFRTKVCTKVKLTLVLSYVRTKVLSFVRKYFRT